MVGISFRAGPASCWTACTGPPYGPGHQRDLRERFPPEALQPKPTVFEQAAAAGIAVRVVSQQVFAGSGLTRAALRGGEFRGTRALGDLAAEIIDAITGPGRRLCYGYHADLDSVGHLRGPGSLAWRLQLAQIDRLAALIAEAPAARGGAGDHRRSRHGARRDGSRRRHRREPAGRSGPARRGSRARHVYAKPGATADVLAAWRSTLGPDAWVVPGEQAMDEGWFGPVAEHVRDRIGDMVVAARGTAAVVRSVAEPFMAKMPGQHGSLSKDEQLVPLLLARTDGQPVSRLARCSETSEQTDIMWPDKSGDDGYAIT